MIGLKERIELLVRLGDYIRLKDEVLLSVMHKAHYNNQWFTIENVEKSLISISNNFLLKEKLEEWMANYDLNEESSELQNVGLVLAGNIPLVGFHDVLACFVAGQKALIKSSSKDEVLLPFLIGKLKEWNHKIDHYFEFVERLNNFDAVIATGSNASAAQFESYFSKYKNIIRKNRNGVAVLNGKESKEDLINLGHDIFGYFGLGCRNVSKIYIPEDYDMTVLIEILHEEFKDIVLHHKYKNNYDYNYAIYLLNKEDFLMSGSLLFRKSKDIISRIACIHYDSYSSISELEKELLERSNEIQCVLSMEALSNLKTYKLGNSQQPNLMDYADGVDTMKFLTETEIPQL